MSCRVPLFIETARSEIPEVEITSSKIVSGAVNLSRKQITH